VPFISTPLLRSQRHAGADSAIVAEFFGRRRKGWIRIATERAKAIDMVWERNSLSRDARGEGLLRTVALPWRDHFSEIHPTT